MSIHELHLDAAGPGERRARDLAAAVLRLASHALGVWAERVALAAPAAATEPLIEYHADAGAPEGALYVNGQLVGHVLGVQRL